MTPERELEIRSGIYWGGLVREEIDKVVGEIFAKIDVLRSENAREYNLRIAIAKERNEVWTERDQLKACLESKDARIEALREAINKTISLTYSWGIAVLTIDCKHTYDEIRVNSREALAADDEAARK